MITIITIMMFNCDKHFQSMILCNNVAACYLCFYNFFVFVILINKMHIKIAFYFINSLFFSMLFVYALSELNVAISLNNITACYESLFSW